MTLKNTWTLPIQIENYSGPVTLSLPEWRKYVASGKNVLHGAGGVIPGGTANTEFGGGGAVYAGHVRQGIEPFTQDNITEHTVSNPILPGHYFSQDLMYFSDLDPNTHYEISFNDLSFSFKSDKDGTIYFNKNNKTIGLPLSCLLYMNIQIRGLPPPLHTCSDNKNEDACKAGCSWNNKKCLSSLPPTPQTPGQLLPPLKKSFTIGLKKSTTNCAGCSSNSDIACFNKHFCYGNNPQCSGDFANTEGNCIGLSQCNWDENNKQSCKLRNNCIWSDDPINMVFFLEFPIPNTTKWGYEHRHMIIQGGTIRTYN